MKIISTQEHQAAGKTGVLELANDVDPRTLQLEGVSRIDLQPINADKALSRDALSYLGETPLTGNPAAIAALKASDLVICAWMSSRG